MMKRTLMKLCAALLLAGASVAHATPQADQAALLQLEQSWVDAAPTHDRTVLDQLLDDSYIETTPSGVRRTKADVMNAPPPPAGATQTLRDMQVSLNGDTAVVQGINRYQPPQSTQYMDFTFTDVFVRHDGRWRVISSQSTRR
ncbi:uncharacterized protein DUF4440 [Paraburkholderia unamae]|uniref:nuclear transport factor 2 family protein n=1 Tax=Paraburkholderia unamae TaxID=219649 RepID=UPI000DC37CFE|nr:nuclear transport factor 2 family protein [Paraburkholderia unamae]RAR61839.1 uncharacterized protein DUF4440 [Paraburkholderia unamae]